LRPKRITAERRVLVKGFAQLSGRELHHLTDLVLRPHERAVQTETHRTIRHELEAFEIELLRRARLRPARH